MNCRECEDRMVDALYGELDGGQLALLESHVESCDACGRLYAEMRETLGVMEGRERPDPGQAWWDGFYNRLTARMENEERERGGRGWLGRLLPGFSQTGLRWAYRGVLAAALVVLGAVAGRLILPGSETMVPTGTVMTENQTPPPVETRVAEAAPEACARQYIEDSKVLLLALVNVDPDTEGEYLADWAPQRRKSSELLVQAASLKHDLDRPEQRRLRELVAELELILMQIANLETTGDLEAVDVIRGAVSEQDVLLKINLEEMRSGVRETPKPGVCDS